MVSPAQVNMRSAAALAGSGVLRRMKRCFNVGQAAMLQVSVDGLFIYCVSSSVRVDDVDDVDAARRLKKAASSSWLSLSSSAEIHICHNDNSREQRIKNRNMEKTTKVNK